MQALRLAASKPKLTPNEIKGILTSTAIDLGRQWLRWCLWIWSCRCL